MTPRTPAASAVTVPAATGAVTVPVAPLPSALGWPLILIRGIVALVTAVVITFSPDHSSVVGLSSFAVFAVLTALILLVQVGGSGRPGFLGRLATAGASAEAGTIVPLRPVLLIQAVATLAAAALAIILVGGGTSVLLLLLAIWAAVTGFAELFLGLRARGRVANSREWVFAGAVTALTSIAVLTVPLDFRHDWSFVDDKTGELVSGAVTAEVAGTGILGFSTAILGVYLLIAGVSYARGLLAASVASSSTTAAADGEVR